MTSTNEVKLINVLSLPDEVLDNILSYIIYDEVSHVRLVCKRFDESAQRVLNQGFCKVRKFHAHCVKNLKELLPRRESERHKHPLAGHCDILSAIESRLSLLDMTFMRHVKLGHCCFIPGKVLDELFRVLRIASVMQVSRRSHELLQELRDISSMAMEHFDDNVVPKFRCKSVIPKLSVRETYQYLDSIRNSSSTVAFTRQASKIYTMYRLLQNKCMMLKNENRVHRRKIMDYRAKFSEMEHIISEQNTILLQQATELNIQETKIEEVIQKFAEYQDYMATVISQHKEQCTVCTPHSYHNCANEPSLNLTNVNPETTSSSSKSSCSKRSNSSDENSCSKRVKKC